jgi:hypothetical protein
MLAITDHAITMIMDATEIGLLLILLIGWRRPSA